MWSEAKEDARAVRIHLDSDGFILRTPDRDHAAMMRELLARLVRSSAELRGRVDQAELDRVIQGLRERLSPDDVACKFQGPVRMH
jgi:hypothetical protein